MSLWHLPANKGLQDHLVQVWWKSNKGTLSILPWASFINKLCLQFLNDCWDHVISVELLHIWMKPNEHFAAFVYAFELKNMFLADKPYKPLTATNTLAAKKRSKAACKSSAKVAAINVPKSAEPSPEANSNDNPETGLSYQPVSISALFIGTLRTDTEDTWDL
ncbi:hypothetical protein C8T65DRAFT_746179 [Cerioporus squamosus]|nr:hypothetical protein C8T65DRAFT_746179 [Cerioporus squamosus]